jgi:Protein of unknown function (DUF2934)
MEKVKKTSTAKKAAATGQNATEPKKTAARKKTGTKDIANGPVPEKAATAPKKAKSNVTQMQTAPNMTAMRISHEEIARLAHRYWAERGRQHGHHEEDWFRAERELLDKAS